jgi:hypothetical protein
MALGPVKRERIHSIERINHAAAGDFIQLADKKIVSWHADNRGVSKSEDVVVPTNES